MEASTDVVKNREGDIQSANGVRGGRTYNLVKTVLRSSASGPAGRAATAPRAVRGGDLGTRAQEVTL
jgi:hypothetical protein